MQRRMVHALDYEHPGGVAWDILLDDLHRLTSVLSRAACVPEQLHLARPAKWALASNAVAHEQAGCMLTGAPVVLVVEGFLLFACQALAKLCAERFFLEIGYSDALSRRWRRDGVKRPDRWQFDATRPPDVPTAKFERWFHQVVWSGYEQHIGTQQQLGQPWHLMDASTESANIVAAQMNASG